MQRAELRIALRAGTQHALAWRLTMRGGDIYAGPPRPARGDELRQSYHESGAPLPPPRSITDRVKVASWSVTPVTWGYRPKPEGAKRRTLVLKPEAHEVPPESWDVALFVIGAGRSDLVDQTLAEHAARGRVLGALQVDWTTPEVLAIVSTFSVEDFRWLRGRPHSPGPDQSRPRPSQCRR